MIYREDDMACRVKIIENHSTDTEYAYKLEVTEVIKQSDFYKDIEVGERFDVSKQRGVAVPGMWTLE